MMVLPIKTWGDEVLTKVAKKVIYKNEKKAILALINDMIETMIIAGGLGLAANQIGVLKRVIIINTSLIREEIRRKDILLIINPEIIKAEGEEVGEEGCLSLPNIRCELNRSKEIVVKGLNIMGKKIKLSFSDLLARIVQHEVDHLNGVLIIDKVSKEERARLLMELQNKN